MLRSPDMRVRKIGAYLAERIPDGRSVVDEALALQAVLATDGKAMPLGQLVLDKGHADDRTLEECLRLQRHDTIASVDLFRTLDPEWVSRIAEVSQYITVPADTVLFRQHDPGDAFYVLVSGTVRVYRESEHGNETTLATLDPGTAFGEIALLTGEPRSASVATREASRLLAIPRDTFDELLSAFPELSRAFVRILADWLSHGDRNVEAASATERSYQQFVSEHLRPIRPRLAGRSREFSRLVARIAELAGNDRPVLVTGEAGTERLETARLIHRESRRKDKPFLWMDAKNVQLGPMEKAPGVMDPVRLELAQCSALFGRAQDTLPFAPGSQLGLLQVGNGGTVVIENIDALMPGVQKHLARYLATGTFHPLGEEHPVSSSVRILATSSGDPARMAEAGRLYPSLRETLSQQVITVPPLRARKKDLRHVVEALIRCYGREAGKDISGVNDEAYKSIMAYDWPGNTDELEVVIRRAVSVARHEQLEPQDIFLAQPPVTGRYTFDLLRIERVRRFFQQGTFAAAAQVVTGLFIGLIIASGFFGPRDPGRNVAPVLTWGLWEPLLILSCLAVARMWCSVCPLRGISRLVQRLGTLERNVPALVRRYGFLLSAAGIGLVFWSQSAFVMLSSSAATATLIAVILCYAVSVAVVYKRMAWCRYLCPLGGMVGLFSSCSAVELRSNYSVCCNDCAQPLCFLGNESHEGCPMFEGPFALSGNQDCTLCGNCIRLCDRNSPVLNLRIPGYELFHIRKPDRRIVAFGLVILGAQVFRALEFHGSFRTLTALPLWAPASLVLLLLCTLLTGLLVWLSGSSLFKTPSTSRLDAAGFMTYGLIPLSASFELAWHLGRLLSSAGTLGTVAAAQLNASYVLPSFVPAAGLTAFLGTAIILVGMAASNMVLARLWKEHGVRGSRPGPALLRRGFILISGGLFIWLIT